MGTRSRTSATWSLPAQCDCANQFIPEVRDNPPAPAPEPVSVSELPLPPTAPSDTAGSCTTRQPDNTGCISAKAFSPTGSQTSVLNNGNFIDNNHVVATVIFTGAPAAPNPGSIYNGIQLIVVKTNGTTFSNGDPWKCITCGLDPSHKQGISTDFSYPQAYTDRTQNPPKPSILVGNNIVQCSGHSFTDETCTLADTFIYPIRWNQQGDGGGAGGDMRELRIHPDGVHLGWNKLEFYGFCPTCPFPLKQIGQYGYFGHLRFNPAPTTGTPAVPRFELDNVTRLNNPAAENQPFRPDPAHAGGAVVQPALTEHRRVPWAGPRTARRRSAQRAVRVGQHRPVRGEPGHRRESSG